MSNLVAYYSWTGNTQVVAEELHGMVGGDLKRIEEERPRKEGIGFAGAAFSALFGLKSRLKPFDFSLKGYEKIYIGGPVWADRSTPAINTFLNEADFTGKMVCLFLTLGDDKIPQKLIDSIKMRVEKRGGKFLDSICIQTVYGSVLDPQAARKEISAWVHKSA